MTKQNPDILCEECKKFDFVMNHQDGVSLDVWVTCEHDEDTEVRERERLEKMNQKTKNP